MPARPHGSVLATILLALLAAPAAAAPVVLTPDGEPPPIVSRLQDGQSTDLVEIGAEGQLAVLVSTRGTGKSTESNLRVVDTAGPQREARIGGRIRDVMFSPDGTELYAIQERPAKKRRAAECFLLRIDLATLQMRRALYLPATSRGLAHWSAGGAVLIAARDEVRSLLLPDLRSGPLYRIAGDNRAIAVVDASLVLLARADELALVDLGDPPEREGMPVRETVVAPAAVVAFALDRSRERGIARLADDRLVRFDVRPLRFEPVAAVETAAAPQATVSAPHEIPPPPAPAAPAPSAPAPAAPEPPVQQEAAAAGDSALVTLSGSISGERGAGALFVVAYGPDDILREAARTSPGPDGAWRILGLGAGRYRVLLDGGGSRVLVTDPPYHVIEVGGASTAPGSIEFRILRSM